MNLEEQIDDMAVKASEDSATIYSLQLQVETLEAGMLSILPTLCDLVYGLYMAASSLSDMKFWKNHGHMTSTPSKQQREDVGLLKDKV